MPKHELGRNCAVLDERSEVLYRGSYEACAEFMAKCEEATELLVPVMRIDEERIVDNAMPRSFTLSQYVNEVSSKSRRASRK